MDRVVTLVLDTSALLFWTLDPERLSRSAARTISEAERILVSSISVWEIGIKVKRGRLSIPVSFREFTDNLERIDRLAILPVDVRTWTRNIDLDWTHRTLPTGPSSPQPVCTPAGSSPPIPSSRGSTRERSGRSASPSANARACVWPGQPATAGWAKRKFPITVGPPSPSGDGYCRCFRSASGL